MYICFHSTIYRYRKSQLTAQAARVEAQIAAESKKKGGLPLGFEKILAQMVGDD